MHFLFRKIKVIVNISEIMVLVPIGRAYKNNSKHFKGKNDAIFEGKKVNWAAWNRSLGINKGALDKI